MKKIVLFHLIILLFACSQSSENNAKGDTSKETGLESKTEKETVKEEDSNGESIDMKSFFSLSPLSIFDETTEGLDLSEKNDLLKKGESTSWKIIDESKTKLAMRSKDPSSEVTLRFLKNKDNLDGLLFAQIVNEKRTNLLSWKYSNEDKNLQKVNILKKYTANDFVHKEDKLPNSYKPVLHYQFVDDQTIEVSLHTWMEKEFENREIINRIFLKWNGEKFEEKIVKNEQVQKTSKLKILDKPDYGLSRLNHKGKIVNERFWQDSNGENIVLFTRNENELYVYHYSINSDNVRLLRKVYDYVKDCDYDLFLEFIENSIKVTDLDKNNYGEITFAYKKACISDISPKDLKLIMLENGNKFIIRGTTSIDKPGIKVDGTKKVDASFNNAPAGFLSHADNIWDDIKKE